MTEKTVANYSQTCSFMLTHSKY